MSNHDAMVETTVPDVAHAPPPRWVRNQDLPPTHAARRGGGHVIFHIHSWSKWHTFDEQKFVDADWGGMWWERWQERQCTRCGKEQIRKRRRAA